MLCATSPNPTTVITAGTSTVVCVWDVKVEKDKLNCVKLRQVSLEVNNSPACVCEPQKPADVGVFFSQPLYGHTDSVTCLAVSEVHSLLVSGSRDLTCILWDMEELSYITQLTRHTASISSLAINDLTVSRHTPSPLPWCFLSNRLRDYTRWRQLAHPHFVVILLSVTPHVCVKGWNRVMRGVASVPVEHEGSTAVTQPFFPRASTRHFVRRLHASPRVGPQKRDHHRLCRWRHTGEVSSAASHYCHGYFEDPNWLSGCIFLNVFLDSLTGRDFYTFSNAALITLALGGQPLGCPSRKIITTRLSWMWLHILPPL